MFSYIKTYTLLFTLMLALSLASCKPAEEANETIKEGTKTVVTQPDRARVLSDVAIIRQTIEAYHATNNSYPQDLKSLNLALNFPDDFIYDPATGKVQNKTFPNL